MAPAKMKALQFVFSGLSNVVPIEVPMPKKGHIPSEFLTPRQQRDLRRLRSKARALGQDPKKVTLESMRPAPVQRRLQQNRMDLLPVPHAMDSAALGRAAGVLAREGGGLHWEAIARRAHELMDTLDPEDVALLLSGMARSRHDDRNVITALRDRALSLVRYMSARHLAMVVSALSRSLDVDPFISEVRERVPEFDAQDLTLVIAALGRTRSLAMVPDLAKEAEVRLASTPLHVREVVRIGSACSRAGIELPHLLPSTKGTLHEATPSELCQFMLFLVRIRPQGTEELLEDCVRLVAEKLNFLGPAELVNAAFACGQVLDAGYAIEMDFLPHIMRKAARLSAHMESWQVCAILRSCSRWRLPVSSGDLEELVSALNSHKLSLGPREAGDALFSLARLVGDQPLTTTSGSDASVGADPPSQEILQVQDVVGPLISTICRGLELGDDASMSFQTGTRAIEAVVIFTDRAPGRPSLERPNTQNLAAAVAAWISRLPTPSAEAAALSLTERLLALGCRPGHPVLDVLQRS